MIRIRTAIIGMGRMGKMRFDKCREHGGFEITGICDSNGKCPVGYDAPYYDDWKKCIEECKPEAIFVCTVNAYIPEIVCFALNKGIHVFSEKPPGRSLTDAQRMQTVSTKHTDTVLKFGFNHRYHNSVIEAKALIASGIVGDVVCARGIYGKAGSINFAREWRNDIKQSSGGILLDQGIHMLDLLRYFLGDFTDIKSNVDTLVWKELATEDSAFAILKTDDGKQAMLHSNALQWKHKFDLDLICTQGYIALNGLITSTNSYGEETITWYKKDLEARSGSLGKPLEHTLCFDRDRSWDLEHQEFYDAIISGIPIRQGTIQDAVEVMRLVTRIYKET